MPDATLARLIMPTTVAERWAQSPPVAPASGNSLLLMRALNAAWPGITDCSNHFQGFDAQYGRFLEVTSGARRRLEQADWHAVQQAMKNRIHLYDHHVRLVVEQLRCITNGQSTDAAFLLRVKEHYTRLLPDYPRFEIAESF